MMCLEMSAVDNDLKWPFTSRECVVCVLCVFVVCVCVCVCVKGINTGFGDVIKSYYLVTQRLLPDYVSLCIQV